MLFCWWEDETEALLSEREGVFGVIESPKIRAGANKHTTKGAPKLRV